jgi:hypothetical protein
MANPRSVHGHNLLAWMQHWNDKKMLPLFFMLLFMMAYKDLDMDESEFFNFLFFRSFNLWMSFTISSSHFPLWCNLCCLLNCLCSKNDELKVKYCHITCHFLFVVFHIVIILGDLLILPLLSFFFFYYGFFSSNC